VVKEK
jgi:hypothetical protein